MLAIYLNENADELFIGSRTLYGIEGTHPDNIADYLEREFVQRPTHILLVKNDSVKVLTAGKDFAE